MTIVPAMIRVTPRSPCPALALIALMLVAGGSGPAQADDTELLVSPAVSARPNVLFIIDTSGSMGAEVLTQAPWDPAATYTGCFDSDALYFATSAIPPDCSSDQRVRKAANFCLDSQNSLAAVGQYTGRLLAWNAQTEQWTGLDGQSPDRPVECQADRGVHGDGVSAQKYAADGPAGPWQPNDGQEPAWNSHYTVFDGNWLNWQSNPPSVTSTRLEVVQSVVNSLIASLNEVNVGLMRFNFDEGGPVVQAMEEVATAGGDMQAAVSALAPGGTTPLSETLYEAGLYFRGGNIDYGNVGPVVSVPESREGALPSSPRYRSPIEDACQKNFIVLLTDGEPSNDSTADNKIKSLPGFAQTVGTQCDGTGEGRCLDDMADYLAHYDQNATLPGDQTIVTHVIGFAIDAPLLASTAERGGGSYYLADDTASLTASLAQLVEGVTSSATTFSAPAIPVNVFNQAESSQDRYLSLFEPSGTAHWAGNLKKYRFIGGQLVGQNGAPVVDAATLLFLPSAWSFWSAEPDGAEVRAGGAASRLPDDTERVVLTNLTGSANVDLRAAGNRVEVTNGLLTAAELNVSAAERDTLIHFARGRDTTDVDGDGDTTEPRREFGDPLHVAPVTVTYGGTAAAPDQLVFVSTNDGYLHAIDADTGIERWAFIPRRLLPRLAELAVDGPAPDKRYGLDGGIRLFVRNDDGQPGFSGPGEQAILLFGMGRGGNAVFALDVTAPDAPRLLWEVDSDTPGLERLGQTWSTPVVTRVAIAGRNPPDDPVVIFGGGYDDGQDGSGYRSQDVVGNAVFMLDLQSGAVLWSGGQTGRGHDLSLDQMVHSIPAPLRVIDLTGDGLADRFYVGDMGGRVWRFDILNGSPRASLVRGGVLASLGAAHLANPPPSEVRRFYATPDVVLSTTNKRVFLAVNIGSGHRGHPLETGVNDAFFSIRDDQVFEPMGNSNYGPLVRTGDLVDITEDPDPELPPDAAGWLLRLVQAPGEKVLSQSLTLNNTVFFASSTPNTDADACVPGPLTNLAYRVSVFDGRPLTNLDDSAEDGPLTIEDRFVELLQSSIAPAPSYLTDEQGQPQICFGIECFPVPGPGRYTRRTYWVQEQPE